MKRKGTITLQTHIGKNKWERRTQMKKAFWKLAEPQKENILPHTDINENIKLIFKRKG